MKHNDEIMMHGHWEQISADGAIVQRTNDYTEQARRICQDLRRQAIGLLGPTARVSYTALSAHNANNESIRFVGKYI